jgi:hypothetical protein
VTRRRVLARLVSGTLPALFACYATRAIAAAPAEAAPSGDSPNADDPSGHDSVQIEWEAPPECPNAQDIQAHAERLLGQPLGAARAQRVVARAVVRRNEAGNWELRLSLTSNERVSEDTLIAKQCLALGDATALKVALAVDPVATARAVALAAGNAESSGNSAAPKPAPVPELRAGPSQVPETDATSSPTPASLGVRLTSGAGLGVLPSVAGGAALALWLQQSAWRAELGAYGFWGGDAHYQRMPAVGARLQLFSAVARGCPILRGGTLEFPICFGLELGVMRGEGYGVERTDSAHSWWGAVAVGPALKAPVSEIFSLWFEADGAFAFLRPGFNVRNLGSLYSAGPGSVRVWAGGEIRFDP